MELWQEIQQLLLMGANGGAVPSEALREFMRAHLPAERLGEGAAVSQQLLDAAAVFALLRKGASVAALPSDVYEPKPLPQNAVLPLPAELSTAVAALLRAGDEEMIEEFAQNFDYQSFRLPDTLLPAWLDWGLRKSMLYLQAQFAAIAGERGAWLAEYNPAWRYALRTISSEEDFLHANAAQRLDYLRRLRAKEPAAAAQIIAQFHKEESAEQLIEWIYLLAQQPQREEVSLLEQLANDRRRTVRRAAFQALSLHENSAQSQRLRQLAAQFLRLDAQKNWIVELPEECTETLQAVGIEEKNYTIEGGEKASFARQLIEMLPPAYWLAQKANALDLLHSARKGEWSEAIIGGLLIAAERFDDGEMRLALHRYYLQNSNAKLWNKLSTDFLGCGLNAKQAHAVAKIYAEDAKINFNDSHPIIRLAMQLKNWSQEAGLALLQILLDGSADEKKQQHYYGLRALVQRAAYCLPYALAPQVAALWEAVRTERNHQWQKDMSRLIGILQRRAQLAAYYTKPQNNSAH